MKPPDSEPTEFAMENDPGIKALADALRRNEKRRRRQATLTYLSIVILGAVVSGCIYIAQLNQIQGLNQRGYESCLNRNEQIKAETDYWKVVSEHSTSEEVRQAAIDAVAKMPLPRDCAALYGFPRDEPTTDPTGSP